ncbi:hypothetical protein LR948_18110 [Roseivivax sp. GX 12232]|uniref:hypothetical protein n=1 Tax=Roseivivax sp. GX 12232 TaxID=2900547 RepID=UPI001E2D8B16|nr:hypothetical protein [Roseivivax sp. GX 12232]MCE0507283.1 hypothetical protein [Roseivivax sp. GX 12232]
MLPDVYVNPETAAKGSEIARPIQTCQLVTVEMDYNAVEAGDHHAMPYLSSDRCMVAMTHFVGGAATAKQIIPSPAAKAQGYHGTFTDYSDAIAHLPVTKPGHQRVEVPLGR